MGLELKTTPHLAILLTEYGRDKIARLLANGYEVEILEEGYYKIVEVRRDGKVVARGMAEFLSHAVSEMLTEMAGVDDEYIT